MKVCVYQTIIEFDPSKNKIKNKLSNGAYLVNIISSVVAKRKFINKPYGFPPPDLDTSVQSHNTSSSTYMVNNNIYQGLIQTKTVIIHIKDQQTVMEHNLIHHLM